MEHLKNIKIKMLLIVGMILVGAAIYWLGSSRYLLTTVLPTNTNMNNVRGDLYIPQNYGGSAGQEGEVEVKVGKQITGLAGLTFTMNYPADLISAYDVSTQGLVTSTFTIMKNTNTAGVLRVSMVQAEGISVPLDTVVLKISVDIKSTVPQGTVIPLTLSTISAYNEDGQVITLAGQNGQIIINDQNLNGSEPYISTIVPDYALSSVDTPIVISGRNLPASIAEAHIGDILLTGVQAVGGQVNATIPKGLATGIYDITLAGTNGVVVTRQNAFTIIEEAEGLTIDSTASYFTPGRVKNDNVMTTTLWVKVDDSYGVEDIEYVDVNLGSIGGSATVRMKADKIVDKSQWFYLSNIKIPTTVPTSTTKYNVMVTATNRLGKVAKGEVGVLVVGDVEVNITPVVQQAYTAPKYVQNNGKTTFKIYAYVTDDDGADKIDNVRIIMTDLGGETKDMSKDGNAIGNGYWYKAEGLTVSTQIKEGMYKAKIMASNKTGDKGEADVDIVVSNKNLPQVLSDSYVAPTHVPADNETQFSVYALVRDQDGIDTIDKVTASFGDLQLAPIEMTKGAMEGDGNWFEAKDLTLPTTVYKGEHEITITATDKDGNTGSATIDLYVVNPSDVKNAPKVDSDRSRTEPYAIANDGKSTVDLYAYVYDPDGNEDIVSVNIDLHALGLKPVNSMERQQTEGKGVWYKFSTKVPPIVAPSSTPYELSIYATDTSGAVGQGVVQLSVVEVNPQQVAAPQIEAAVPISPTTIEVIFNKVLNPLSVQQTGGNFQILDRSDITQHLNVLSATLNTRNNIVILQTDPQQALKPYTVIVDARVKDTEGVAVRENFSDRVDFHGYKKDLKAPTVRRVEATGPNTVEVVFWGSIRPSSIALDGSDTLIWKIEDARVLLPVKKVSFKNDTTLLLTTEDQEYGKEYGLKIKNIANNSGVNEGNIQVYFKGFMSALVGDLDGNGTVDFNDFTIFADSYHKAQGYEESGGTYSEKMQENGNGNTNTNENINAS